MGAARHCAFGYGTRSTNIKGVSRRRGATRGREREEVVERLALERFPPSEVEGDGELCTVIEEMVQ